MQTYIGTYMDAYVHILFHALFHYGLLQDTEYSSLCPAGGGLLFISLIYSGWQRGTTYGTLRPRLGSEPSILWMMSLNPPSLGRANRLLLCTWVHAARTVRALPRGLMRPLGHRR